MRIKEMEGKKGKSRSKSKRVSTIVLVAFAFAIFMVAPAIAGTVSYDYDDAGRLIKANYGNGTTIEYEYDNAGNLLTVNVTALVLNCTCGDICVNETGWWRDGDDFNPCNAPIWAAVNSSAVGKTICVKDGAYNENVDVNKRLTIRSENGSASTIVNASDSNDHVFNVTANWVNISGFTVQNATNSTYPQTAGIYLGNGVEHCNISDNNATNNYFGICLWSSDNNNVTNNTCNSNGNSGLYLEQSNSNIVSDNVCNQNTGEGIWLDQSNNNAISNNTANLNNRGIDLEGQSNDNIVTNNTCNLNNMLGISLLYGNPGNNNSFADNTASNNTDYDFYSHEGAYNNTVEGLTIASYPSTISFTYDNGIGIKGVTTPEPDPAGKANISKYVNATNVTADSWLFLNVSYEDGDLGSVDENSLRMWKHNGTDWTEVQQPNGVNTVENYVYANITEFSVFAPLGNVTDATPHITSFAPPSSVSDTEGATRTFNITINQAVNVSWQINGIAVQTNKSETEASYTNVSAKVGTWNVSAIVNNTNGTDMQTWTWNVEAPSPCYIATATYGTPLDENINVLRDFRDEVLMTNPIGETFVSTYYTTSPPIADALRGNDGLRTITRLTLITPLVSLSKFALNGIWLVLILGLTVTAVLSLRKYRDRKKILKPLLAGVGSILVFIAAIFSLGFAGYTIPFCAVVGAYMLPFVIPVSVVFTLGTVLKLRINVSDNTKMHAQNSKM